MSASGAPTRNNAGTGKLAAELVGTFAIVFTGCGASMVAERFPSSVPPGVVPVVFGLAVTVMIYAVGHISGAHFNPAVSLAFAVFRHFPKRELIAYWGAQFAGALMAIFLLRASLPMGEHYGATSPALPLPAALFWEVSLSFILMFVITAVATDTRAVGMLAGAAIGGTVALCAFVGGPLTGASMNPARSLAPALAEGRTQDLWIYFVGPAAGAILAAWAYNAIRCSESTSVKEGVRGPVAAAIPVNRKDTKGCC